MDNRSVSKGITQNYFTFSGRLNRKPFILRSIVATFVPILLAILLFLLFAGGFRPGMEYQHKNLLWLHVLLHSLLIILAIVAGFLGMIPYINVAWGLYLMCKRGTVGRNRYGDDPIYDDYDTIEDSTKDIRKQ